MKKVHKQFQRTDVLLLSLLSGLLIFFCVFHIRELDQIIILNDEFGYWSVAAAMAGKNWGELILSTPYYSYGYSIFLIPLFYLGFPSYVIYKAAIFLNVIIVILGYWISVICGKKFFPRMNKKVLIVIGFIINCYPNMLIQAQIAWTESLLNFLFWMTVLNVILIIENPKFWKILTFIILLGYMFIVHQRTIGIVIAGGITLILMGISGKIPLKKVFVSIGILSVILILHFYIKGELKTWLWANSEISNINDFSAQTSLINLVFSKDGIENIFYGLAGRMFYFLAAGGIIWYLGFVRIFENISYEIKKNTTNVLERISYVEIFIVLSFFSAVAIGLTSIVHGFSRIDTIVYGRYIENTIGPILLIGAGTLFEKKLSIKHVASYFLMFVITYFLTIQALQLVENNNFVDVCSVGIAKFFENKSGAEAVAHIIIDMSILSGIVCALVSNKWKKKGCLVAGIVVLLYWLNMADYTYVHTIENVQLEKTENNEGIAELLRAADVNEIFYVRDNMLDPYCTNPKYLQFWIPDIKINLVEQVDKETISSDGIWICEKESKNAQEYIKDANILIENKEFYVYTQTDSQIISELKQKGYSFEHSLDLSTAESKICDSNYEGFQSNGDAGKLVKNYNVKLSAGTYNVNFNIEVINDTGKRILGKCQVTKYGGKEILEELIIDNKVLQSNQIQFSCMDTDDIELNIDVEKDVILRVNSITYEKINASYLVGSDCKQDILAIVDKINSLYSKQVGYISTHKNMKYDFSYLEEMYPELSFDVIKVNELERAESDYIILERNNVDIFEYLDRYDCLMVNATYILLTDKESGIAQLWKDNGNEICSNNDFININILRLNTDGTMYSDNAISLSQGTYEIIFDSEEMLGNVQLYVGEMQEKMNFDLNLKKVAKVISIKDKNKYISWKINSMKGDAPQIIIRKIDHSYSVDLPGEDKIVLDAGEKITMPLFDNLEMGTYEFIFTMSSENTEFSDVEFLLYRKDNLSNEILMNTADNSEKEIDKRTTHIKQRYDVGKAGFQGIECIIKNKSKTPITLESIQFRTID